MTDGETAEAEAPGGRLLAGDAQVCAQVLLLREHGYACDHGEIYYTKDRRRVPIAIDDALVRRTLEAVFELGGDDPWGLGGGLERPVRRLFPARDDVQAQGAMCAWTGSGSSCNRSARVRRKRASRTPRRHLRCSPAADLRVGVSECVRSS